MARHYYVIRDDGGSYVRLLTPQGMFWTPNLKAALKLATPEAAQVVIDSRKVKNIKMVIEELDG